MVSLGAKSCGFLAESGGQDCLGILEVISSTAYKSSCYLCWIFWRNLPCNPAHWCFCSFPPLFSKFLVIFHVLRFSVLSGTPSLIKSFCFNFDKHMS